MTTQNPTTQNQTAPNLYLQEDSKSEICIIVCDDMIALRNIFSLVYEFEPPYETWRDCNTNAIARTLGTTICVKSKSILTNTPANSVFNIHIVKSTAGADEEFKKAVSRYKKKNKKNPQPIKEGD